MKIKEYNVQLICIDNNRCFIVKVIGIYSISDEILVVKILYLLEVFGVLNIRFCCGKGYVDLLIGIDYVYMYVGEIR